ncbi:MAG: RHS repeat-associated core domain-containing protein, partial [Verrucomicrobiota bacterium]|nr:RHS repeat-associated core domain-containing protein [Verrucomicrobiota bacterium]
MLIFTTPFGKNRHFPIGARIYPSPEPTPAPIISSTFGEPLTYALSSNPWRYSAKRYDSELGLYYFGQRYYDPLLARWLTLDPAGFVNGTNLYAYALNNPLNLLDPDGTFAIPLFTWAIGGAVCPFAIGAAVAIGVGYMACWGVQKMIDHGS